MQWIAIVALSILACISYGIIHDQITARICVEYFTIGHPMIIPTDDPTILGIVWGIVATWWVGAILGVPLATLARIGPRPKKPASSLVRPMAILFAISALLALLAGLVGYVAASMGWVWLVGKMAEDVPQEKHVAFLVDLWAHSASYFAGFVGGIILMVWIWRSRGVVSPQSAIGHRVGSEEIGRGQSFDHIDLKSIQVGTPPPALVVNRLIRNANVIHIDDLLLVSTVRRLTDFNPIIKSVAWDV